MCSWSGCVCHSVEHCTCLSHVVVSCKHAMVQCLESFWICSFGYLCIWQTSNQSFTLAVVGPACNIDYWDYHMARSNCFCNVQQGLVSICMYLLHSLRLYNVHSNIPQADNAFISSNRTGCIIDNGDDCGSAVLEPLCWAHSRTVRTFATLARSVWHPASCWCSVMKTMLYFWCICTCVLIVQRERLGWNLAQWDPID